jgi:hypothetical protein
MKAIHDLKPENVFDRGEEYIAEEDSNVNTQQDGDIGRISKSSFNSQETALGIHVPLYQELWKTKRKNPITTKSNQYSMGALSRSYAKTIFKFPPSSRVRIILKRDVEHKLSRFTARFRKFREKNMGSEDWGDTLK